MFLGLTFDELIVLGAVPIVVFPTLYIEQISSPENPELSDREYSAEDLDHSEMEKDEFTEAFSALSPEEQAEVLYDTMGEGSAGGSYVRAGLAGLTTGATATGAGIAATVLTGGNPIAGAVAAGVAATGGKLAEQYALDHLGDEASDPAGSQCVRRSDSFSNALADRTVISRSKQRSVKLSASRH